MSDDPSSALAALREGNDRFRDGRARSYPVLPDQLPILARQDRPLAALVTCSDARLVPEVIFDQPPGALFVVRLAGAVAAPEAIGSLELAAPRLRAPAVVVLGHLDCLAVRAAFDRAPLAGRAYDVTRRIAWAVRGCGSLDEAVAANVRAVCEEMRSRSRTLSSITLRGAVYRMETGEIAWLEP